MPKPVKTPEELQQLIRDEAMKDEDIASDVAGTPGETLEVAMPYWHERDTDGVNWNCRGTAGYADHLHGYIRTVRAMYDCVEPS